MQFLKLCWNVLFPKPKVVFELWDLNFVWAFKEVLQTIFLVFTGTGKPLSTAASEQKEVGIIGKLTQAEGNSSAVPVVLPSVSHQKSPNFSVPPFLGFISASVPVHEKSSVHWNRQHAVINLKYFFMEVCYNASFHPFVFPWISSEFNHQNTIGSCWWFLIDCCQQQEFKIPEKNTDFSLNILLLWLVYKS